jgi:Rha family phage regulatory protein
MNELMTKQTTMSSLEIVKLTNKQHKNVLRDIDTLLESLSSNLSLGFKSTTYKDNSGKENRCFILDKDSTICLVSGYDANVRMKIIKR